MGASTINQPFPPWSCIFSTIIGGFSKKVGSISVPCPDQPWSPDLENLVRFVEDFFEESCRTTLPPIGNFYTFLHTFSENPYPPSYGKPVAQFRAIKGWWEYDEHRECIHGYSIVNRSGSTFLFTSAQVSIDPVQPSCWDDHHLVLYGFIMFYQTWQNTFGRKSNVFIWRNRNMQSSSIILVLDFPLPCLLTTGIH